MVPTEPGSSSPYPVRYETDVVLRDGGTVHVRPIRPDDAEELVAAFARLSFETIHYRFFSLKHRLTDREVAHFTTVDYKDRFAFVGVLDGALIAVVRYDRELGSDRAEVALVIDDAHQHRGLGTVLLEHLAGAARDNGIRVFTASVLPDNRRMVRVFRDTGWKVHDRFSDGVIEVSFPIELTDESLEVMGERERWADARSIERILVPESVAVIGASDRAGSVGFHVFHNLMRNGFAGPVYPVNPRLDELDGNVVYRALADVPDEVDLAIIAVRSDAVPGVVRECAAKKVKGVVVLSAGFGETGPEGRLLEREVLDIIRGHGMRMVGPNCIGVLNTDIGLDATFAPEYPRKGRVAFQSQSGGLGIALIEWSRELGVGLSSFVSVGNKADVSGNDLLQYWEQDDNTDVILMYLESFGNPRKFARIARRVSRSKPIVAVKSGRTDSGTRAAQSHTAAAASADVVVSALFRQAGVIRVDTLEDLLDTALVLASQPLPNGNRVAIIGNSGGPGILAADACEGAGLEVRPFAAETTERLRGLLGPNAAVANPVDMIASATPDQYEAVLRIVLDEAEIDSVIVIYTPPMVSSPDEIAAAIAAGAAEATKPIVANFLGSRSVPDALRGTDTDRRIPSFPSPEPAAITLGRITRYAEWRDRDPGTVPQLDDIDRPQARRLVDAELVRIERDGTEGWLDLDVAARLLSAYGIPVVPTERVRDEAEAAAAAGRCGYPVALKIATGSVVHKSDAGGVRIGLRTPTELVAAVTEMRERFAVPEGPNAPSPALIVQPMVEPGVETIVGVLHDLHFGPVIMFGIGGVATDLLGDRGFRILPLTDVDAHELVRSLRASPLLFGYRGAEPVDAGQLEDLLLRVGALAEDVPEIAELDLNPVAADAQGVTAVDIKVRLQPAPATPSTVLRSLD